MARRYRYSFTKKKEAKKGKLSAGLAAASFLLFITAVVLAYLLDNSFGFLVGGVAYLHPSFRIRIYYGTAQLF